VPGSVEEEFRAYLECGILCFGFGRALCTGCGQGFVVAFSCKGRGVCPSCNGRHMAQTAAHLVDRVIPPVPVRQWVISVPKRLRVFLADRPEAVAAFTKIFLDEIERLLCAAAGTTPAPKTAAAARPRLGAVSFLHRFGSALNRHVHLHACVTDGVFVPPATGPANDAPPAFLPARPINPADLAAVTEKVRRRLIRWLKRTRLLDAEAAADMLAWEHSGFSVDASVRITLLDRDVPSYFQSLEHLLRYCARPPFALERLSVSRGADGQIARIRYVLPRHKVANWVGPSRSHKSTRPGANGVVELSPFEFLNRLADLVPPPRKHRHRPAGGWRGDRAKPRLWLRPPIGGRGHGWPCRRETSQASLRPITRSGPPSRHSRSGTSASDTRPRRTGTRVTGTARKAAATRLTHIKSPARMTRRALPGRSSWRGWGRSFHLRARAVAVTSG
jgi:hypothetical protein